MAYFGGFLVYWLVWRVIFPLILPGRSHSSIYSASQRWAGRRVKWPPRLPVYAERSADARLLTLATIAAIICLFRERQCEMGY